MCSLGSSVKYKRVLLKISGESLAGAKGFGHDSSIIDAICNDVASAVSLGVQVCIVVGGGNFLRGSSSTFKSERASHDYMGMLATAINALALQNSLDRARVPSRVLSAIQMTELCEPYVRLRAIRHLEKGRVVIFACGTGNPFFTTDTAAALRAAEVNCDVIMKGTRVDGVYSGDPEKDSSAVRYDRISYNDLISMRLKVMDTAAISLAMENAIPIIVFNIGVGGAFCNLIKGADAVHTLVS